MSDLSAVLPLWRDRPPEENLAIATTAEEFGYRDLWIGEMATYDTFALATRIGTDTRLGLTVGPLAVGVRTPVSIAMGVASVSDLIGRRVNVAVGASSPVVVRQWHGRSWSDTARQLDESVEIIRVLLEGGAAGTTATERPATVTDSGSVHRGRISRWQRSGQRLWRSALRRPTASCSTW